jgi:SAM-dependent methyltransferase
LIALPRAGRALDLGCGPADVTLRVARRLEGWHIDGVDGSQEMLELGRRAVDAAQLAARVRLERARLPDEAPPADAYDLVFSNSLLHHLDDPLALWSSARRFAAPAARIFVMDLARPRSTTQVDDLVARYADDEAPILRRDFRNSLRAAYRVAEVEGQVAEAGLAGVRVELVSDRHWIAWGTLG